MSQRRRGRQPHGNHPPFYCGVRVICVIFGNIPRDAQRHLEMGSLGNSSFVS